ncbi:MAG TPA: glycosyltransferase family 2 protein [Candidatus Saccharimonadales bacterium]|nr:glycosyltransferase family 2 protein [Candidatus Saccharimonadales bacterium]
MIDLDIPLEQDRHFKYRFFEILPGALTWTLLFMPFILSLVSVTAAAFFILGYIIVYFTRSVAVDVRALAGFRDMRKYMRLPWLELDAEIEALSLNDASVIRPKWHYDNLIRLGLRGPVIKPSEVIHAIIIATYNEERTIIETTIERILQSDYDMKKVIFILAYESRAGAEKEQQSEELVERYREHFYYASAVKHPNNIPNEQIGKGGNATYAGHWLEHYLEQQRIDPLRVIVTVLDADNRPDKQYLAALTYLYCVAPDPVRASYQPLPMYTNNIWDAPAPMRVIATGNNFFYIVLTQRPHLERNFSAHAQSMRALIDMNFWSVRTIVEDGHQFWRSYFYYNGDYRVYPMYVPIYQDAVLAKGYIRTLKAQFIQLRRWTYGASDIAYIADQGFFKKNTVPKRDLISKFLRTLEGHVTWASGALLLTFAAFVPVLLHPQNYTANELPLIVSRIQTFGLIGALASLYVSIRTLPPRPARYKRHRSIFMILQWLYLPITTIAYGSFAAIYSQTRIMLGWYISKFDTTEKAVVSGSQTPANSKP